MKWTIGLDIYSDIVTIFKPKAIDDQGVIRDIEEKKYHIYLVCKRKKMYYESFDPNQMVAKFYTLDENHCKCYNRYHNRDIVINGFNDGIANITFKERNWSIADFALLNNYHFIEGDEIGDSIESKLPSDLEVMYVGQAFGRTGNRNIDYRLKNHEKLQSIAADIIERGTNEEILIVGISVKTHDLSFRIFDGVKEIDRDSIDQEVDELIVKAKKRPSEGQIVTLFEASLISYFHPIYNKEYKVTFPSPDFSSYDEIYDMDFDFFSFALNTGKGSIFCRLYSEVQQMKYIHIGVYIIGNNNDNLELLDYIQKKNETT
jgi:hypothetical protein